MNKHSTANPYARQIPRGDERPAVIPFNRTDAESVDDLVDKIIESIPAEMLIKAVASLNERTRIQYSPAELRKRFDRLGVPELDLEAAEGIEVLKAELIESAKAFALLIADEAAEEAIENGDFDDLFDDLVDAVVYEIVV